MNHTQYISVMRDLRLKYGIRITQLAVHAGVSPQYLSALELGRYFAGERAIHLVRLAFERVVEEETKRAFRLSEDYFINQYRLLDFIPCEREGIP